VDFPRSPRPDAINFGGRLINIRDRQ